MSKSTPGPWIVEEAGNENLNYNFRISSEHRVIAQVWPHHNRNSKSEENLTDEANAPLIAASPQILEASKETYKMLLNMTTEDFKRGKDRMVRELLELAISAAEGKEEGK